MNCRRAHGTTCERLTTLFWFSFTTADGSATALRGCVPILARRLSQSRRISVTRHIHPLIWTTTTRPLSHPGFCASGRRSLTTEKRFGMSYPRSGVYQHQPLYIFSYPPRRRRGVVPFMTERIWHFDRARFNPTPVVISTMTYSRCRMYMRWIA